jgi:hypothetical protein
LFKETAIGYLVAATVVVLFALHKKHIGWQSAVLAFSVFAAILAIYMSLRRAVGLGMPSSGSTAVIFGMNIPRNLVQLWTAAVTPVSTVQIFVATVQHEWLRLAALALGPLAVSVLVIYGLVHPPLSQSCRQVALFCGLMLSLLFPAFMVAHVSELYAYSCLPLIAFGLTLAIQKASRARLGRTAACAVVMVLLVVQVSAIWSKADLLKQNGEASDRLVGQLVELIRGLPVGTVLYLRDLQGDQPAYSVYLERGFTPIQYAEKYISYTSNRPDVVIQWLRPNSPPVGAIEGVVVVQPLVPDRPIEGALVLNKPHHVEPTRP